MGRLVAMALLGLVCLSLVQAQAADPKQPESVSIRSSLTQVKVQLIELVRRSGFQAGFLLYRPTGLVVILTQSDFTGEGLRSVALRGTGTDLVFHNYTFLETAALRRGGSHRVLSLGHLGSDLTLTATVTVLDSRKETRTLETEFSVKQNPLPAVVELKLMALPGQDLQLTTQVMVQPNATQMEEIFTRDIRYLIDTGSYLQAAASLLTVLEQDRKTTHLQVERNLLLGRTYLEWGLDSEAARLLNEIAARSSPGVQSAIAWFYLEKLYYRQGAYDKVLEAYSKAQGHLPRAFLAEAHYLAGNSLLYRRSYLKAVEPLSLVPEDNEWYPFALYSSGLAYLNAKDASSALNQFRKLMELDPGGYLSLEALIDRARITLGFFMVDQGRYEKALEIFGKVPPSSLYADRAQFGVGWTYLRRGECEKAVVIFEDLVSQWPESTFGQEAQLKIGACYSKLKTYRKAVENYKEALRFYSDRHEKLRGLQDDLSKTPLRDWLKTQGLLLSDMDSGRLVLSKQITDHPALEMTRFLKGSGRKSPLLRELAARTAVQEAIAAFEDLERLSAQVNSRRDETSDASGLASPQRLLQQVRKPLEARVKEVLNEQLEDLKKHLEERALQADIALLKNFNLINP